MRPPQEGAAMKMRDSSSKAQSYEQRCWLLVLLGVLVLGLLVWGGRLHAQPPVGAFGLPSQPVGAASWDDPQPSTHAPRVLAEGKKKGDKHNSRHGWVRIYAASGAQITVDDKPYPRRSEYGVQVTAGERHEVKVKVGDKEKKYVVAVRPREVHTLLVDLTGWQSPPGAGEAPPPITSPAATTDEPAEPVEEEATEGEEGKLTVYSKPKGEVYVDGAAIGATTPMINRELELGRHEIQVKWETGQMSEVKTIRVRKGSKLKLFFRDRNEE
jgi:hypothetical protein